ncbi:MAG: hypothetical protein ACK5LY_05250 [Lachnospirales bacterium]
MAVKGMSKKEKVNNKVAGINHVDEKYTNSQAIKEKMKDVNNEADSPEFNNIRG